MLNSQEQQTVKYVQITKRTFQKADTVIETLFLGCLKFFMRLLRGISGYFSKSRG